MSDNRYDNKHLNPGQSARKRIAIGSPIQPWRIEDELKGLGANFIQAGLWTGFAIRDGNLLTGQQDFSGTETAQLVIESLGR